ncbi:MAG: cysteine desulfurase [Bacteroidales bacterium]|jgi:cysteine desulfurase/selenocysteine lyase|nr:cysteine desulfurase [Bacteroidales bacterium]
MAKFFDEIKKQFPIFKGTEWKDLVYLDSAASSQSPDCVINAVSDYYSTTHSNVHRGVHSLSQKATQIYESARQKVQQFINAKYAHEIIFTRGTTESINLIADTFAKKYLQPNDEILLSQMEHHSNIVPWQMAAQRTGAKLKIIPINENGELLMEDFRNLFSQNTKIVAITHISNVLGTINPVKELIAFAHQQNVPVLIDGAQGIKSQNIDVQELDCDFYCFSGHKMYAPTGIGILYGKEKHLEALPPYQGGGDMIERVSFEKTTFNALPFKFEAGTPNIGGAVGLSAAIDFINDCGVENLIEHELQLLDYATNRLHEIEGIRIIGNAAQKAGVISFLLAQHHPADVGTLLNMMNIAVRTGHHCAQPLMDRLQIKGTVRASFGVYNSKEDIDKLVIALCKVKQMLS